MMSSASYATPGSPAAANAAEHACSRHPDLLGPRFCFDCRGPLCTACTRHRPHRTCPSCNVAAGRKASVPDVGWFVMLCIDGFLDAIGTVRKRVLPFAVASSMLGLAGVLAVFLGVGDADVAKAADAERVALLAFTALFFTVGLGLWAQPALSLPTTTPIGIGRRVLRSVVGTALPTAVAFAIMSAGVGLMVLGETLDSVAITVLGTIVGGFVLFASMALSSTVLPIQAAYAVRSRSLMAALKTPFQGGGVALLMMTLTWLMLLSMLYSAMYAAVIPVVVVGVFAPWLAVVVGLPLAIAGLTLLLVLTATYASASLRIAEDRARRA